MVQVILPRDNERYSIPELAQMAIEGGCRWLRIDGTDAADEYIREFCAEIVPLCQESGVMLSLDGKAELAKELGLHGVHIADKSVSPAAVREDLGPEAVIGVTTGDPALAFQLMKADIDYVQLPDNFDEGQIAAFMIDFRELDPHYPIVALGGESAASAAGIKALGVSGVAIQIGDIATSDPVTEIAAIIEAVQ